MNGDLTTMKNNNKKSDIKWTKEQEELLAEWSEKATCYRWLHSRSEKLYRARNYTFTIPVIILSTLTGTANFAMDSFVPEENKQVAMAAVGSVNIFAGILSTLQNFLRYAELMEAHRQSEVLWSKFSRNIAIELTLEPKRRKNADDFLKTCRQEYDQLIESSPTIDDPIINQFKKNFKNATLKKPDICNGLDECKIYTPSKDEKIEDIVSNAGEKLLKIKNKPKWSKPVKKEEPKPILQKEPKHIFKPDIMIDSKKELDNLSTIGKVSSFKQKLEQTDIENKINEENDSPMEAIHKVVQIISEKNIVKDDEVKDDDVKDDEVKDDEVKDDEVKDDTSCDKCREKNKTEILDTEEGDKEEEDKEEEDKEDEITEEGHVSIFIGELDKC
jgi:hypothetical protein